MAEVHLRCVTADNERECLGLRVGDAQMTFVASNATSLTQAKANPKLEGIPLKAGEVYLRLPAEK